MSQHELFEKAESCRTGASGEIDISRALEILSQDELADCDIAVITKQIINNFPAYISESLFRALRDFILFRFRSYRLGLSSTQYNLTVEADEDFDVKDFAVKLNDTIKAVMPEPKGKIVSINDIIDKTEKTLSEDTDIIIVKDADERLFDNTDYIRSAFEATPAISKILILSPSLAERLKTENSSFYYQVMGHEQSNHPTAIMFKENDIYSIFIKRLTQNPLYSVSDGFRIGMKQYIDVVYPNADLQKEAFIEELLGRVERQAIKAAFIEKDEDGKIILTAECVPESIRVNRIKQEEAALNADTAKKSEQKSDEQQSEKAKKLDDIVLDKPDFTPSKSARKRTFNVLLLALSTFPVNRVMKKTKYSYGKDEIYEGYYQLEPVPKMLSKKFNAEGDCLDKIICLTTAKTEISFEATLKDEKDIVTDTVNCSANDYFKYSIQPFMNSEVDPESLIEFFKIDEKDEKSLNEGTKNIVSRLRELKKEKSESDIELNLYIDTHGGFRDVGLVFQSVISLLKYEEINIKERYIVRFETNENTIVTDNSARLFSFVSGINEFVNFGRCQSLVEFFGGNNSKLTEAITDISNGISLCDMNTFQGGLDKIKIALDTLEADNPDKYIGIFRNTIQNDYGVLLSDHTVIDEIEWCRKKGHFQAALTLLESKMPELLFESGSIDLSREDKVRFGELKNADRSSYPEEDFYCWLLKKWTKRNWNLTENNFINIDVNNLFPNGRNQLSRIFFVNFRDNPNSSGNSDNTADSDNIRIYRDDIRFSHNDGNSKTKYAKAFINLHWFLKYQRNQSNHASEQDTRLTVDDVGKLLDNYIEIYRNWVR